MELADVITVYSEKTPNPESMKFVANRMVLPNDSIDFRVKENLETCPMAEELFQYDFVKGVFIMNNFVSITKKEDYDWFDIIPQLKKFVQESKYNSIILMLKMQDIHFNSLGSSMAKILDIKIY